VAISPFTSAALAALAINTAAANPMTAALPIVFDIRQSSSPCYYGEEASAFAA
jgi:hypothetical protein